ncbi:MAG: hypothetical protein B7733_11275 [Myxococcales bacterium FL481]|nr:MAG: hypothetical protein B7733_11275 [Myxococcales bacterium FL481]
MNRAIAIASATYLCVIGQVHRVSALDYQGSDALQDVTAYLVDTGECGAINTLFLGSTAAENAMCDSLQESAPMARALRNYKVCPNSPVDDPSTPEIEGRADPACQAQTVRGRAGGLVIGWEALAVARGVGEGPTCGNLVDWQATLALLYGGSAPVGGGDPDGTNCATQERIDLVADWNGLFVQDCGDECPQGLRHALRHDDTSRVTGVFRGLVGLDGFCNGAAPGRVNDDNDPLRTPCAASERYCPDGDLGVVLAISVPRARGNEPEGFEAAANNNSPCEFGAFEWAAGFGFSPLCPNGTGRLGGSAGLCLFPVDAHGDCGCNNSRFNLPPGSLPGVDGRLYNERARYPDCRPVTSTISEFHRLSVDCEANNAMRQIGCIVGAQECYVGWAGREIFEGNADVLEPVLIDGVSPQDNTDVTAGDYPLSRRMYLNTLSGLDDVTDPDEQSLVECFHDVEQLATAVALDGFVPVSSLEFEPLDCSEWD